MSAPRLDLGLAEEDVRALCAARERPIPLDREAALRLIRDASQLVAAAVRMRPLPGGRPFTLPGHTERPGS
jgi:hypothetical protein